MFLTAPKNFAFCFIGDQLWTFFLENVFSEIIFLVDFIFFMEEKKSIKQQY